MWQLYCWLSVFLVFLARSSLAHEVLVEEHAHFSFPALVDAVNDDLLAVTRLFDKLQYPNCSTLRGQNESCHRCFPLGEYENSTGFKASALLNSTQFLRIAPTLVYFLLPEQNSGPSGAVCKTPPLPEKLFEALVANYSASAKGITEEALDEILERINETSGKYLHKSECFSAHGIFEEIKEGSHEEDEDHDSHEEEDDHDHDHDHDHDSHDGEDQDSHGSESLHKMNQSSLDEDEFQKACASILFHLVEGYCIKDDHAHTETSKLPPKTFFISNLFGAKKRMTEEDLEKLTKKLGIGEGAAHVDEKDSHAGHNHRRSIHVPGDYSVRMGAAHNIHRRAVDDHGHEEHKEGAHQNFGSTCFSLDDMLTIFGVDHKVGVDQKQFKELCPAFIQQFQRGVCNTVKTLSPVTKDMAKIWGYGFAAVTIISLLSLIGVATIPFIGKKLYKKILALLVALAVGSLAGDGILHLIPHAFELHAHDHAAGAGGHDPSEQDYLWKALAVIGSIYAFYLFESMMHLCLKGRGAHSHIDTEKGPSSHHNTKGRGQSCSKLEHHEGIPHVEDEKPISSNGAIVLTNYTHTNELKDSDNDNADAYSSAGGEDDHKVKKGISTVAWMIIIGDTLHNISDGLAIGAAFSEGGSSGISGGISTSIAVFCHELPHELGDFAVLLSAGMSVKMALLANFLSACSCYIGLVIGIAIGQMTDVRLWIFAIAGGMFVYVALVDMLPDLMHSETLQTEPGVTFLLQNIGIITGTVIMLLIAVYEEQLKAVEF